MPDFIYPPLSVNLPPETAVVIRLTDRDDITYDWRTAAPGDVGMLNAAAQESSDGELWWEVFDTLSVTDPMRHAVEWNAGDRAIEFGDLDTAQAFKQAHPGWRVFYTVATSFDLGKDGGLTQLSDEQFFAGMGFQ